MAWNSSVSWAPAAPESASTVTAPSLLEIDTVTGPVGSLSSTAV